MLKDQVTKIKASGADIFFNVATPKFAAQAIRRVYDIGWKPLHLLNGVSRSIGSVLKPAGLDKSTGIISVLVFKETTDPQWKDDPGYKDWLAWMQKYYPDGDLEDWANVLGYTQAQMLVQVLEQCGDDLTRENIMKQAANLHHVKLPMLLPGITVDTSPTNYQPIKEVRMARFDGHTWEIFGHVMMVGNSSR
jgi:branched-chain amino acid transport system substrate-binding protein